MFISFPVLGPTTGYELGFHLNQLVMAVSFMDTIQRDVRAANSVRQLVFTEDGIPVLAGLVRQRLEQSEAEQSSQQTKSESILSSELVTLVRLLREHVSPRTKPRQVSQGG